MNVMPFWTSPHPGLPMSRWSGDGRIALKAALQPRRGGGHAAACERAADLLHDRKLVAQLCDWPITRLREMVHPSCTQRSTASRFCSLTLHDRRRRVRATPIRQRSATEMLFWRRLWHRHRNSLRRAIVLVAAVFSAHQLGNQMEFLPVAVHPPRQRPSVQRHDRLVVRTAGREQGRYACKHAPAPNRFRRGSSSTKNQSATAPSIA